MRPLRTAVYAPAIDADVAGWRRRIAELDGSGLTALTVSDHFSYNLMDPVVGLAAIADATTTVRVMALLFCVDYRHPVVLHKAAATLDVLSGGRLDLGLGAGFLADEYAAAGLTLDPAGTRIERLEEAVHVVTALFEAERVEHVGVNFHITGLTGRPSPRQLPRPPLVLGGGGKRMLALAGRWADIIGIHSNLGRGTAYDAGVIEDMRPARMVEKVRWARDAAEAAGRDPDRLDYLYINWGCRVVDHAHDTDTAWREVAGRFGVDVATARDSLGLLVGTVDQCLTQLLERRDRYGLNYVNFGAADLDMLTPLLRELATNDVTP